MQVQTLDVWLMGNLHIKVCLQVSGSSTAHVEKKKKQCKGFCGFRGSCVRSDKISAGLKSTSSKIKAKGKETWGCGAGEERAHHTSPLTFGCYCSRG